MPSGPWSIIEIQWGVPAWRARNERLAERHQVILYDPCGPGVIRSTCVRSGLSIGDKRLLTFVETDGCFIDGVAVATGCSVGHRTMRIVGQGKVAVTFVDTATEQSVRTWPRNTARTKALAYTGRDSSDRWLAQRDGYLCMPSSELLQSSPVELGVSLDALISRPGLLVACAACGEEVINGREVHLGDAAYCHACGGETYVQLYLPAAA